MLWSIRYRLLCWLFHLLVRFGLDEVDLETVVLRHQLKVLRRGGRRVVFTTADRAFLAAAARVLSRDRRKSFLVDPDTLMRWHRDFHRGKRSSDRSRDRLFEDAGVRYVDRIDVEDTNDPAALDAFVARFLARLGGRSVSAGPQMEVG